jgi:membrane protein
MKDGPVARIRWHLGHPLPLLEHLVLRTESHAYCAGLAFFALVGFYPSCLLALWVSRHLLRWAPADIVLVQTLREYYPDGQEFLLRNLTLSVEEYGRGMTLPAVFWILLGAAGVFIPLETAFNQLWGAASHRPYWRNQAVGFLLTAACCLLAVLFVLGTAGLQTFLQGLSVSPFLGRALVYGALRLAALVLSVLAIFLFYRFLPNTEVRAHQVFPAAVFAGLVSEAARYLYLLALPLLQLQKSQGPYYISISFALLAYFESFVVLAGAYLAARPTGAKEIERVLPYSSSAP